MSDSAPSYTCGGCGRSFGARPIRCECGASFGADPLDRGPLVQTQARAGGIGIDVLNAGGAQLEPPVLLIELDANARVVAPIPASLAGQGCHADVMGADVDLVFGFADVDAVPGPGMLLRAGEKGVPLVMPSRSSATHVVATVARGSRATIVFR